ncbi:hypothetical protein O181_032113 [Austropuccinia psidii MF-1]|uniref:Retrovirus-related Pol polyprotein from transposon TNT 1-94-like beta-barrel domain-containing protein n=1 Tax=Austropuccinia psidii MF-1 TaxID=1389203 RepID=A0A9Q3H581_9BASI|nr:hypothetical protein [Austropuccinia psidii MF-1]
MEKTENDRGEDESIAFVSITRLELRGEAIVSNFEKRTILDSGASKHMFARKEDFSDLKTSDCQVQIGQEEVKIPIEGKEEVIKYPNEKRLV